jgi:hypothetical protein
MKEARKIVANIVRHFMNHVVPGVVRPLHVLWNEIIGLFFLVFAVAFGGAAIRGFRNLGKGGSMGLVILSACLALLMLYYGVTSFLKARKISRR